MPPGAPSGSAGPAGASTQRTSGGALERLRTCRAMGRPPERSSPPRPPGRAAAVAAAMLPSESIFKTYERALLPHTSESPTSSGRSSPYARSSPLTLVPDGVSKGKA